eukprot:TRINITY_DN1728_c0_g1_i1.p2 TRINITY_DN1728_c0_g1~~TRINITY_DN1728_c0_g1_i1.p2  ORF type:complete len:104 (+),score=24.42 TRINITY_DN1728_c0_g1_i1:194-505(+)
MYSASCPFGMADVMNARNSDNPAPSATPKIAVPTYAYGLEDSSFNTKYIMGTRTFQEIKTDRHALYKPNFEPSFVANNAPKMPHTCASMSAIATSALVIPSTS